MIKEKLHPVTGKPVGGTSKLQTETPKSQIDSRNPISRAKIQKPTVSTAPVKTDTQNVSTETFGTPKNRNNFNSDRDYETYILDNRIDTTKGDAFNYLQQKAKEQNMGTRGYIEGMRTRYKNQKETEKTYEKYQQGQMADKDVEELNNKFSAIIDNEGNEVDYNKYASDVELVNKTAQDINSKMEKLSKDYANGKIDYATMQNEYARYNDMLNENSALGEQLNSYKNVQGFDYYDWAKQTGKDVSDFEAYVENYNDWLPERLAQSWTASWYDTLNTIPSAVDDVINFFNPEYDGNKLSGKMDETSQLLKEYAHFGEKVWQEYPLKAVEGLMPYVNNLLVANMAGAFMPNAVAGLSHKNLLGNTVEGTEALAGYLMGMQSASQTYRQRLSEGNGQVTSALNAIIHGIISVKVEEYNAGELPALLLGSGNAKYLTGMALIQKASPKMILSMMHDAGKNEGTEELIETFVDFVADETQNFLWGNLSGDKVAVTELNPKDMATEYFLAYAGSYILGVPGAVSITIDSRQKYNAAQRALEHCDSTLASPIAMAEEKELAQKVKEGLEFAMRPYEQLSTTEGIELAKDQVEPMATYDEMMDNLVNAMQPDAVAQYNHAQETLAHAMNTEAMLQSSLYERGINMKANQFLDLDDNTRQNIIQKNKAIQEACPNANIEYATYYEVDGENAMADSNAMIITMEGGKPTIVVNPNGETSLIVSALHEILHTTEGSEEYNDIYNTVFSEKGSDLKKINELLGNRYKGFELGQVGKEALVITITEDMMSEADAEKFINHMAKYNTSFAYKMMYKLKDMLGMTKNDSQLEKVTRMLTNALSKQNAVYLENGVAYLKPKNYDSRHQLADFAKDPKNALRDGNTYYSPVSRIGRYQWMPEELKSSAIVFQREALEQFLTGDHFVLQHESHENSTTGIDVAKNLDYLIDNPLAVYKTPDNSGSYTVILDIKDNQGNPIIVGFSPVELAPRKVSYYDLEMKPHTEFAGMIKGLYGKTKWGTYIDENGKKQLTYDGENAFNHFFEKYGDPLFPEGKTKDDVMKSVGRLLLSASSDTSSNPSINDYLRKSRQLDIIEASRTKSDGLNESSNKIEDIRTFEQTLTDPELDVLTTSDFTEDDIKEALQKGYVKIYSTHPVVGGTFVTPSLDEAEYMWPDKKLYEREVYLDNVAWQDDLHGQYAPIKPEIQFSKRSIDTHLTNENDSDILSEEDGHEQFRRLQEESQRILDESGWGSERQVHYLADEAVRGRFSNILKGELDSRGYGIGHDNGLLDLGTDSNFKIYKDVDGETFHDIFNTVRNALPFGELVDVHPIETTEHDGWTETGYNETHNYLSDDGMAGFSITKDGDLISVFNASGKKGFLRSVAPFIRQNAKTLDCYVLDPSISGTNLQEMYNKAFGFVTTRTEDYNWDYDHDGIGKRYSEPKIAYMENPNYGMTLQYSKFDPAKNKDMRDNLGNKINKNMANRITGTRLTDSQGRPLLLYHTSSSLFSEFDPRGTDYYHYGDKIVNFYSTDPEVSGSYAYDPMQIRSAEDYAKHEKAETESKRLRKELADTEDQYDARIYELEVELFDYSKTKEFRSVISNAISSLEGYKFDNRLEDGVRQFQIAYLEDLKNVDHRELWYERFKDFRGWAERNATIDSQYEGYGDIFQAIVDSDGFKKMSEIYDQIQLTAVDKSNSLAPIKAELKDYGRLKNSGKQYVGYGKALNPYILKNNSPNVNWSYLNDGDFDIDFQDYLSLQTELWNIFPKASEAELDEMMKSKNRINRFILSNVDDDIRALLIENPIILANITNMAKDSYYVDGYGSLWYDDEYEPTSMEQFVNNLDAKFAEAYDRVDNSHLFTNSVTTNDVVTATLAVNDYTDNPYDGVVFENITDSASGEADDIVSDIVAMFESNQFKLMDNQNPTDNPDIRYSKKRRTDTQQSVSNEDEGVSNRYYDYGMNPARNVDILRETEAGPTRRHANNMANSEWVSDDEAQRIVEAVESGDYAYAPVHFAEIDEQAKDTLRRIGKAKAMQEVTTDTENVTLEKAALARQLLAQMREDGQEGTPEYERLQRINTSFYTPSAQILAYGRWLRQSTPEGQIITIESEIARMQSELEQRWGDRAPDLVIPEDLRREYIETKDEARRQAIREEIAQLIADKIPPTILEQMNSFRHLAMLFNPKTWTKNRLSNAIFGGIDELTRAIRSGLETVAKNYGDKHESSIFHGMELQAGAYNRFDEQERKLKKQFEQDYMDNFKQNISKYSNMDIGAFLSTSDFGDMVKDRRKSFSWEFLNQLEKINKGEGHSNNKILDKILKQFGLNDAPAMKNAYSKAMVGYFKKNNLDMNTVTDEQMKKARDFAFAEALYATFNTNNWLATQITEFERKADKKGRDVGAFARMAVESFIPFKRTPLNIIRTGYNYTTLGMATNLARDLYLVKHGKMNANQMINHLAQGLTGTGLVALGMLLSHLGIFRTKDDDKDRKQYFDEDNGEQDYSLNFDGFSYTVDWLDPMVVPMAMGAEIAQAIDENGLSWDNALGIASSVADPIFETSMLSGISKNLQSYQKGTKEWYGEIAKNIARNYVSQYVPSAFGATARTIDDTRRNTYADPNNKNPFNSKFAKQIKNKLPGLSMTNEPYINKQGQVEKNEDLGIGIAGRAFLNFVSPGYYSSKDIDKYDEELYRLYDSTGDLNAFPSQASKDVTFDKETMKFTDKEYTEWQKTRWQTEAKYVNEFIDSDAYKNLSDDERLATIKDIREYAQKVAKKEFLEGRGKEYNNDKQLNNATSALESGIELYDYYDYLNNAGTKQADKIKYLEDMDLTQEQREQLYDLSGYKTSYQDAYNKSMKDKEKSTNKKSSSKKKSSGGSKKASGGKSKSGGGSKPSGTLKMGKSFKLANPTNLKLDTQKVNTNKYLSSYYNTMRGSKNVSSGSSGTVVCPRCGNRVSASSGRCPVCGARL